jgi:hypothetical protein
MNKGDVMAIVMILIGLIIAAILIGLFTNGSGFRLY